MKGSRALRNGVWSLVEGYRAEARFSSVRAVRNGRPKARMCEGCGRIRGTAAGQLLQRQHRPLQPISRRIHSSAVPHSWHTSPAKPPTSHPTTSEPLPEQLRSIMRLLPHSVVVCTSRQPGPEGDIRAMTMSSFTSLTLSPTPLVTFNIATPSRTLDAIRDSGAFTVHILAGDAAGAAAASHFTRGNLGGHVLEGFEGTCDEDGDSPVLKSEGIMFALRCKVLKDAAEGGLVRVRDHVIVVGEVVEMVPGVREKGFGLVYGDRQYRQVGEVLENE